MMKLPADLTKMTTHHPWNVLLNNKIVHCIKLTESVQIKVFLP